MAGSYGPILEGLAARHTVVGIDYPGSGDTPRSTTALSVDDLADQLVAAADAEGLDRFAVSGYSLGGPIAIRAATRHPERVTALVLTAAFAYRDNRLALISSIWSKIASSNNPELLGEFLLMVALGTDALESMPFEQLQQTIGFAGSTAADGSAEQTDLVGRVDVRDDLANIKVPTLVISTTDDRVASPSCTANSPTRFPAPNWRRSPPATCRCSSAARNGCTSSPTSSASATAKSTPAVGPRRGRRRGPTAVHRVPTPWSNTLGP